MYDDMTVSLKKSAGETAKSAVSLMDYATDTRTRQLGSSTSANLMVVFLWKYMCYPQAEVLKSLLRVLPPKSRLMMGVILDFPTYTLMELGRG